MTYSRQISRGKTKAGLEMNERASWNPIGHVPTRCFMTSHADSRPLLNFIRVIKNQGPAMDKRNCVKYI